MDRLSAHDITILLVSLGLLLAAARLFGEWAQRWGQPAVLGELLAGVILGPSVLGAFAPELTAYFFPRSGHAALALDGFITLAIALFLLVAGIEVDLSTMWRQGRAAATIGAAGIFVPFLLGYLVALALPRMIPGVLADNGVNPQLFALFFATALSISALPVIARTLMDLALYRSDMGMVVIAAAILNDLAGWIIFAVILSLMGTTAEHGMGITGTILLTLGFAAGMLTIGRALIHRTLPWLQAHTTWPGGVLAFALSIALFSAAFTEWVGVHAIFGAFLAGVAIGDSPHLREHTRAIIGDFVSFIFAPVFFASIGLRVNFIDAFNLPLVLIVLVIACAGKIVGCGLGARWSGLLARESWAIGFAMNARGAMEIILGLLALEYGLIGEPMFVALVIMALATSMISGPAIYRILGLRKLRRISDFLPPKGFINPLTASTREQAIQTLAAAADSICRIGHDVIVQAVLEREELMPTGIGNGVAIPHARVERLDRPVVTLGVSLHGVDFNAPDGEPAQLIFLILTPLQDARSQIEILSELGRLLKEPHMRAAVLRAETYTQFLALVRTKSA